jgi:hypothetical protein
LNIGIKTPLPLCGISPKGEKSMFHLVKLQETGSNFPPLGGNEKAGDLAALSGYFGS